MGGFAKLAAGILVLCRCSFEKSAKLHFFGKTFAHRVCPNFYIFGIKLHCCPVIYFLTDLKNNYSLQSYEFSKLRNIYFGEQLRVQFLGNAMGNVPSDSNFYWVSYRNRTRKCSRKQIFLNFENS